MQKLGTSYVLGRDELSDYFMLRTCERASDPRPPLLSSLARSLLSRGRKDRVGRSPYLWPPNPLQRLQRYFSLAVENRPLSVIVRYYWPLAVPQWRLKNRKSRRRRQNNAVNSRPDADGRTRLRHFCRPARRADADARPRLLHFAETLFRLENYSGALKFLESYLSRGYAYTLGQIKGDKAL